ncbi:MAG: serine/threonine protein kinase [Methylibium sp.]|uniref:serine/threonine protein kinase n=1 Tax=Methylibium sp. TaxID=2067992 RepID=UPI00181C7B1B|nr:serine/threonine-protein kinase [Methylibium sp.]MBA3598652.1 serine/threonine protein kinase [Methylibium sp.]
MPTPTALPGFEPTQHYQRHARVALIPGSRVGEFEIVRVLGVGGFSIVYLARDPALDRLVAIKEYLPSALAMRGEGAQVELRTSSNAQTFEQGLDSFLEEARMLARFDHPSLVRVHHFWKANGTAYMAMRYLEGTTLLTARRAMPRPPDEAWLRALLGSLLGAVEALHAESCLHRDISPDNILLLPDATPVLLDFGAARHIVGEGSQQLTAILKPGFAPIEQYAEATDLRQGPWTDLYALGAVMRNCITARPPIPSTVRAVGDRLPSLALEVRTLSASFPGLNYSPGFLAAIDWALALRPSERPQSVAQFRQALALGGADSVGAAAATGEARQLRPAAVAQGAITTTARLLAHAHGAAAVLSRRWPAAAASLAARWTGSVAASGAGPAATQIGAGAASDTARPPGDASAKAPAESQCPTLRAPRQARLRRALPWSMAAVLLGAAGSVGWHSFDERRVGRDMAVMASSAAAVAERQATPDAFAAPELVTEQEPEEPAAIYTRQPPAYEPPQDLQVAGTPMSRESEESVADPDTGLITEWLTPAMNAQASHQPVQAVESVTTSAVAQQSARGVREAPGGVGGGPSSIAEVGGASPRKVAARRGESPRRICARQERYTDYVCMQRQCKLSRFSGHVQCANLRKTGWWGFVRLP